MATTTTTSKKTTSTTKKAPAKKTTTATAPAAKKTATTTTAKVCNDNSTMGKASSTSCNAQVKAATAKKNVISPEEFYRLVAEQAYFIAEARGFAPGNQLLDWLEAEKIVQNKLLT